MVTPYTRTAVGAQEFWCLDLDLELSFIHSFRLLNYDCDILKTICLHLRGYTIIH